MAAAKNPKPLPRHTRKAGSGKLTEIDRAFAIHYVGAARGIAAHAAKMAGCQCANDVAFRRRGYELMQRPTVIAEIDRLRIEAAARIEITAEDVLVDLVRVRDKARLLPPTSANLKVELTAIEKIGDHVGVMAFRKQLGLSNPTGGPIETVDLTQFTDEELEALELARGIIDGRAGGDGDPERGGATGGEGTPTPGA